MSFAQARFLICAIASGMAASFTSAADLVPPAWRGAEGSTLQVWGFAVPDNPAAPAFIQNPYGNAVASITVGQYGSGWFWHLSGVGTPTGYWDLGFTGGNILVEIADRPRTTGQTQISVQVTYFKDLTHAPTVEVRGAVLVSGRTVQVEHVPTGGDWMLDQSLWRLASPTDQVLVTIRSVPAYGAVVEEVVVDTLPSTAPASCHSPRYDSDGNGMVDHNDMIAFEACSAGPAVPWSNTGTDCACFDQDGDGDVDQEDFGSFQRCYSGNRAADVNCAW